jgi:ketosteroid isomerase-like protein
MHNSRRRLGRRSACKALLVAFAVMVASALAQNSASDVASRILSLETSWNQAEQQQDIKALENLLGEKFIYVDVDGTFQDRAEFLAGVKNRAEYIDAIGVEPGATKIYVYGDSAVASGIYREKGRLRGKAYYNRGRFTDTWVRQGTAWVCVASQSTLIPTT